MHMPVSIARKTDFRALDLIALLGPTACGKTALAVTLSEVLDAEIISADSRQLYRGMDIGTGKDLNEYRTAGGATVPYHLIDIAEPGYKYNVFEYQRDFLEVYHRIRERGRMPLLCGGTGLYLEAVLRGYRLMPVPENKALREELESCSLSELVGMLSQYKNLHNTTDTDTKKRAIRAIEIEEYYRSHAEEEPSFPAIRSLVVGIKVDRELRRRRISDRLHLRLGEGMIEEVRRLIENGVSAEDLIYYGLEYKYITLYLLGKLSYDEMFSGLEISIHRFAKRQMTWFRGMERRGIYIHWLDGAVLTKEEMKDKVLSLIEEYYGN